MDNSDDGKEIVLGKLQEREKQRQLELEKRREEREQIGSNPQQVNYFEKVFAERYQEIENALNISVLQTMEPTQLPPHFSRVISDMHVLQKLVSDSTIFLNLYKIRKAQERIQMLQNKCQELEDKLIPKKKFGFKTKKVGNVRENKSEKRIVEETDNASVKCNYPNIMNELLIASCGFCNRNNEMLCLSHEKLCNKDVTLTSLESCIVRLSGAPVTLHITSLTDCKIFSGPVATSVFIENCINCVFVVACQQLRVHSSSNCDFYLHVTSKAIIEDSVEIRLAPYNWTYKGLEDHFVEVGLDLDVNNWSEVDDFNWLARDKHSPNWNIIDEKHRIEKWE